MKLLILFLLLVISDNSFSQDSDSPDITYKIIVLDTSESNLHSLKNPEINLSNKRIIPPINRFLNYACIYSDEPIFLDETEKNYFSFFWYYLAAKYLEFIPGKLENKNIEKKQIKMNNCFITDLENEPVILTKPFAPNDSIIKTQALQQEMFYPREGQFIFYRAKFSLMLRENFLYAQPTEDNLTDTICRLQVTYKGKEGINFITGYGEDSFQVINEIAIQRKDFLALNEFQDFIIDYSFGEIISPVKIQNHIPYEILLKDLQKKRFCDNVEFRIIWQGKPDLQLGIKKIVISDHRGYDMFSGFAFTNEVLKSIIARLFSNKQFSNKKIIIRIDDYFTEDTFIVAEKIKQWLKEYSNDRMKIEINNKFFD